VSFIAPFDAGVELVAAVGEATGDGCALFCGAGLFWLRQDESANSAMAMRKILTSIFIMTKLAWLMV
jgi:hypothetical protein